MSATAKLSKGAQMAMAETLGRLVDSLLGVAGNLPDDVREGWAVNWAAVRCDNVALKTDLWPYAEEPRWLVEIDKAESPELAAWVRDRLAERGWPNVEVRCEW